MVNFSKFMRYLACIGILYAHTTVLGFGMFGGSNQSADPMDIENNSLVTHSKFTPAAAQELLNIGYDPNFDAIQWQLNNKGEPRIQEATVNQYNTLWQLVIATQQYISTQSHLASFLQMFDENFNGYDIAPLIKDDLTLGAELQKPGKPHSTVSLQDGLTREACEKNYAKSLVKLTPSKYAQAQEMLRSQEKEWKDITKITLDPLAQKTIRTEGLNIIYILMMQNMITDEVISSNATLIDLANHIKQTRKEICDHIKTAQSAANVSAEKKKYDAALKALEKNLLIQAQDLRTHQTGVRQRILNYAAILKAPDVDSPERNENIYKAFPVGKDVSVPSSYMPSLNPLYNRFGTHHRVTGAQTTLNPHIKPDHIKRAYQGFFKQLVKDQEYGPHTHFITLRRPVPVHLMPDSNIPLDQPIREEKKIATINNRVEDIEDVDASWSMIPDNNVSNDPDALTYSPPSIFSTPATEPTEDLLNRAYLWPHDSEYPNTHSIYDTSTAYLFNAAMRLPQSHIPTEDIQRVMEVMHTENYAIHPRALLESWTAQNTPIVESLTPLTGATTEDYGVIVPYIPPHAVWNTLERRAILSNIQRSLGHPWGFINPWLFHH